MRKIRKIANHLDFGMPRNREIVVHNYATRSVPFHAKRFADERSFVARRPNFHATGNEFVTGLQTGVGQIRGMYSGASFDAKIDKMFQRFRSEERRVAQE